MSSTTTQTLRDLNSLLPSGPPPSIGSRIRWWQAHINAPSAIEDVSVRASRHTTPTDRAGSSQQSESGGSSNEQEGRDSARLLRESTSQSTRSTESMLEAQIKRLLEDLGAWENIYQIMALDNEALKKRNEELKARLRVSEVAGSTLSEAGTH